MTNSVAAVIDQWHDEIERFELDLIPRYDWEVSESAYRAEMEKIKLENERRYDEAVEDAIAMEIAWSRIGLGMHEMA